METTKSAAVDLEQLVRLPDFYYPVVSQDGTRVVHYSDISGQMELREQDITTGTARQVSKGQLPRSLHAGFALSRSGTAIVFPRDVEGDEQHDLWLLNVETGDATRATDVDGAQELALEFSPDDQWVSFLSTRDGQLNLYKMRPDGTDATQLTTFENPVVWGGQWSPDGSRLTAMSNESTDLHNLDIYLVSSDGGTPYKAHTGGNGTQDFATAWSPDGRTLAITSDALGVNRAGVLDLDSAHVTWLGGGACEEESRTFSRNGKLLLVLRNQNARQLPVIYDLETGEEHSPALPGAGSVGLSTDVDFAGEGDALIIKYSTDSARPMLLHYDLASNRGSVLLAPEYGRLDPSIFVTAEDVTYPSFDGLQIHALLYRPREDRGAPGPAIVMPHGGPTWQYFHRFDPYVQYLVGRGLTILAPNIRGSTGYGVEFRDMARLDWGGADLQDIVAGREYLASRPFVDPERVGVFGGSYGGFMTYIAVTKAPESWKAGVAWVGISDLAAMYEESMPHFKYFLREQMGDPKENADLWADRSAANFAAQMRARLLIVHGVNDPRCPISQARIFRDRLLAAGHQEGRDFEYVELGAEGHGSTDQDQRLRAYRLVGAFLDRVL